MRWTVLGCYDLSEHSIHMIETHDEAFFHWQSRALQDRTVLHVDAHADCFPGAFIDIGSYLHHATRAGLVSAVYWVIPQQTCRWPRLFRRVIQSLIRHGLVVEDSYMPLVVTGRMGRASVWVGPIQHLPKIREVVLLDIDLDFFTTPFADGQFIEGLVLWEHPAEVLHRIQASQVNWDIATVSISVAGGYTLPQWRCLSDYLATVLDGRNEPFDLSELSQGAILYFCGRKNEALEHFRALLRQQSPPARLAAALLWLTRLYVEAGYPRQARSCLDSAIELDPGYRGIWVCPAFAYWYLRCFPYDIASCCEAWKPVIGGDARLYALWAMSLCSRDPSTAMDLAKHAIQIDPESPDGYLCMGRIMRLSGRAREAVPYLRTALDLISAGKPSLMDPIHASQRPHAAHASAVISVVKEMMRTLAQSGQTREAQRYSDFLQHKGLLTLDDELFLERFRMWEGNTSMRNILRPASLFLREAGDAARRVIHRYSWTMQYQQIRRDLIRSAANRWEHRFSDAERTVARR